MNEGESSDETKGWRVEVKGLASRRWREASLPLQAEIILERGLEGNGRRKLRDLSLDYPILFPRQANLAIQSCSASCERVLHPAQKPSQLQKPELKLD